MWSILSRDEICNIAKAWMTITRRMQENKTYLIEVIGSTGNPLLHHILTRRADEENARRFNDEAR